MEVTFENVLIGVKFFDPYSGEYWTKVSDTEAKVESGGDLGGIDMFYGDEIV